jgi:hypothetical protein
VAKTEQKPRITVTDRRLADRLRNPFGEPTAPVDLKDQTRECRWFNAAIATDKIWRAKNKGWDPVRPTDVSDLDQIGGYVVSPDGFVTRGDRGAEVLMSIPSDWRSQIEIAKSKANNRNLGNPIAQKNEVVEAAGRTLGDEAATAMQKHITPVGSVTDGYERVQQVPEGAE